MKDQIKEAITRASSDLNSKRLTYSINFCFSWASQSLKILDIELIQNPNYDLNFEWGNGINEQDLIVLENEGFLKKISEEIDKHDPLEKTIEYEIVITV